MNEGPDVGTLGEKELHEMASNEAARSRYEHAFVVPVSQGCSPVLVGHLLLQQA